MKRFTSLLYFLSLCCVGSALPLGNPSESTLYHSCCCTNCGEACSEPIRWQDAIHFRVGYYGDFVFERHLQTEFYPSQSVRACHIETNAGIVVLNLCSLVDFFSTLGATRLKIAAPESIYTSLGFDGAGALETRYNFSWSVGARATLWERGGWSVGTEGQYLCTHPNLDHYLSFDGRSITFFDQAEITYNEWQLGLGISYALSTLYEEVSFIPYAGVAYSFGKWNGHQIDFDVMMQTFEVPCLKTSRHWGYALGLTLLLCKGFGITFEKRFVNENALYVGGQLRF